MKKTREMSTKELKRKYNSWMKNFIYGIQALVNEEPRGQQLFFYILLQECLYNKTTNPLIAQMYCRDEEFYKQDDDGGLMEDYQLTPLNRKRLMEAFSDLIVGAGRKKFTNTLTEIKHSQETGGY